MKTELYGSDDCFTTFFTTKEEADLDAIFTRIRESNEDAIQIDLSIPAFSDDELNEQFLQLIEEVYVFLKNNHLLIELES